MLFQRICPGCRAVAARAPLCGSCESALAARAPLGDVTAPEGLDRVLVLYRYDPMVRRLVLAAKNGARRDLLHRLGRALGDLLAQEAVKGPGAVPAGVAPFGGFDLATWVPAGRRSARRRGYDQGRVLARAVAGGRGRPPARRLLIRRPGPDRIGADRAHRLEGPSLRAPLRCPARVLLIDDVVTTGASLRAGALALRGAGAIEVTALVIAKA